MPKNGRIAKLSNKYGLTEMLAHKEQIRNCIWVDGFIYEHESPESIYFVGDPTHTSRFVIKKNDIVEIWPNGEVEFFGETLKKCKLFVSNDAVVLKLTVYLGVHLPAEIEQIQLQLRQKQDRISGGPYHIPNLLNEPGHIPGPPPTPSPSPSPSLSPARGGGVGLSTPVNLRA